jgi:hypothetical protein
MTGISLVCEVVQPVTRDLGVFKTRKPTGFDAKLHVILHIPLEYNFVPQIQEIIVIIEASKSLSIYTVAWCLRRREFCRLIQV